MKGGVLDLLDLGVAMLSILCILIDMSKEATIPFDPVAYIRTAKEAALYFDDALRSGDPSVIAAALDTIVRARGASEVAKSSAMSRLAIYNRLFDGGGEA